MGKQSHEETFCIYREGKVPCRMIKELSEMVHTAQESRTICDLCLKGQLIDKLDDMQKMKHIR